MGGKRARRDLDVHYDILTRDNMLRPLNVRCKHCSYEGVHNVTRMRDHFVQKHEKERPPATNQHTLYSFGDRTYGGAMQKRFEYLLVKLQVHSSLRREQRGLVYVFSYQIGSALSLESVTSNDMHNLCQLLRPEAIVPSATTLGRRRKEMFIDLQAKLQQYLLMNGGSVTLQVDGWEDHNRCECFGITLRLPDPSTKTLLFDIQRLEGRATSQNLTKILKVGIFFSRLTTLFYHHS